jgi:hypothetical protein
MTRSVARLAIVAVCGLTVMPASAAPAPQHRHHESTRPAASGGNQVAPPQPDAAPLPPMPVLSAAQVLSGPLPMYPPSPASPFNATPSTYGPRPGAWPFHRPRGLFVLGGYALSADAPPEPAASIANSAATPETESIAPAAPPVDSRLLIPDSRLLIPDSRLLTPDSLLPRPPVTLYVIPRCYAGNRPPADGMLAPGCDLAKMRTVIVQ